MMTDIEKVRSIIQDTPLYSICDADLDGVITAVQLPFFPVVESSVIITGALTPTVDEDNGVLSFPSAPTAQTATVQYKHVCFLDATLQAFLDLNDGDIRLAAADALDSMATSQAMIQKKIKSLDLQTDGPALATALREHAKVLREVASGRGEAEFDIVEQINDEFGFHEKLIKDWMRGL
jgi:hypothetical protein